MADAEGSTRDALADVGEVPPEAAARTPTVIAYKGFEHDWTCRQFQYEVGKTYCLDREVDLCEQGFHACEYPLDVLRYYPASCSWAPYMDAVCGPSPGSRFARVTLGGALTAVGYFSKVAASTITVQAELCLCELTQAAVDYSFARAIPVDGASPTWSAAEHGAASTSEERTAASTTGERGTLSAAGDYCAATTTGERAAARSSGFHGLAGATGDYAAAITTGHGGAACATGARGAACAADGGAACATGHFGIASVSGPAGAASATDFCGTASALGRRAVACATGEQGAAIARGPHAVALAAGFRGQALAADGCAIVLVNRDEKGAIRHVRAAKVGENGIRPDTWYTLNDAGEFEELT